MSFNVIKYRPDLKTEWNGFVSTSKNGTFLFDRNFMEYHQDRFQDYSLMIYKENQLFAILPAHLENTTLYAHKGLTYGSFVLQNDAYLLDVVAAFQATLKYLSDEGISHLYIKVIPTFYNQLPSDELIYCLFKLEAQLEKRDALMVIDYQNQLPFKKNRREGINKAIRHGLEVRIDNNYDGFWKEVLEPNLKRKHGIAPVHSLEEIKLLASRFPDNIKQVSVYDGDKIVAGTTIFLTETTVHPQYVSGNLDKNSMGSLDLAYDFAINNFKDGRRYFDFNISSEDGGSVLNAGLLFWKETCGARTYTADNYLVATASYNKLNVQLR